MRTNGFRTLFIQTESDVIRIKIDFSLLFSELSSKLKSEKLRDADMTVITLKKNETQQITEKKVRYAEKQRKGLDTKKYCGKIELKEDPLAYQRRIRDEWN